jgi:hypothetical protein
MIRELLKRPDVGCVIITLAAFVFYWALDANWKYYLSTGFLGGIWAAYYFFARER